MSVVVYIYIPVTTVPAAMDEYPSLFLALATNRHSGVSGDTIDLFVGDTLSALTAWASAASEDAASGGAGGMHTTWERRPVPSSTAATTAAAEELPTSSFCGGSFGR